LTHCIWTAKKSPTCVSRGVATVQEVTETVQEGFLAWSSSQNVVALIRAGDTGCRLRIETQHVLVACTACSICVTRDSSRWAKYPEQNWQWVTFCDPWPSPRLWHVESITTILTNHDEFTTINCLLCNDVQSGVLDMAYVVYIFIA